jgi:hypothetical protein
MRLINTKTLNVEEFRAVASAPEYAILSHLWGEDEPTYALWNRRLTRLRRARQPGFAKVLASCKRARRDGIAYLWADTVCIDKSSSAELSEAINSMFAWYEKAKVCYVHLADVTVDPLSRQDLLDSFKQSRWFTRGWTLQELLAPHHVTFYTATWTPLGTKNALASAISTVTGIEQSCICKESRLRDFSIAQRMSWAADRSTTRIEDMAYCLLGIFRISMPLVYGEGVEAFRRLQEEIIKVYDDHSIFAFDTSNSLNSVLADHPGLFRQAGRIQPSFSLNMTPPFSMTNAGLTLRTPLVKTLSPYFVLSVLNCVEIECQESIQRWQICLPLFGKDGTYMRAREPVQLIRKATSEPGAEFSAEIQDLTTSANTEYLVSYFTRIYPALGNLLDPALSGFDGETARTGFLLTFPRGFAGYSLLQAYPQNALQKDTSLFVPGIPSAGQAFPHGLLVFNKNAENLEEQKQVAVYLAHTMGITPEVGEGNWMCEVTPSTDEKFYEQCNHTWPFEEVPEKWKHYDHKNNIIVAARTKFQYGNPSQQIVMVEIVFDAQVLLRERGLL